MADIANLMKFYEGGPVGQLGRGRPVTNDTTINRREFLTVERYKKQHLVFNPSHFILLSFLRIVKALMNS
jgi:hypothetical protein